MPEDIIQGVVVNIDGDKPSLISKGENVVPGDFMELGDYDALKEKGHRLGVGAGELVWTVKGRQEVVVVLNNIRKLIKETTHRGLFSVGIKDEQVLYEIDSGVRTSDDPNLNRVRIQLARARNLISGQSPILIEDDFRGTKFQKAVIEKAISDGWQDIKEKSSFKNETSHPWYLSKSDGDDLSNAPKPARKTF